MWRWTRCLVILLILANPIYADNNGFNQNKPSNPPNLDIIKKQLIQYHDSGEYNKQLMQSIRTAMKYLSFRVKQEKYLNQHQKLALVLDIDETSLSNYPDLYKFQFGGTKKQIEAAEYAGQDAAIPYTKILYRYAKANQVAVFFVTGRREKARAATEKNLKAVGYKNWDGIFFKPDHYAKSSVIPYKSSRRKQIEKMGYDIVLNIGDQFSDLKGGYSDMAIKMPNPYYYIN